MLRCSPCFSNTILCQIDEVLKFNISHIAIVILSHEQWIQTSLPVKVGGLGIRPAFYLTLSACLASAISTISLQDLILIRSVAATDKYYTLYRSNWSSTFNQSFPLGATACKHQASTFNQSFPLGATACKYQAWDEPIVIISSQQHLSKINLDLFL